MITKRNDLLSKKVIQSLKNRHMNGYYVHSKQEAVDLAFEIMKPCSTRSSAAVTKIFKA